MNLTIADLYPYELCAITEKVAKQKKLLELNKTNPVKVLKVDSQWLVVDGANRVVASKEMGRTTIEATEVFRQANEMPHFSQCLAKAVASGLRGYAGFPQHETEPAGGVRPAMPQLHAADWRPSAPRGPRPPPRPVAPARAAGLDEAAVMAIVRGCVTRERYRLAGVIHDKRWLVKKADKSVDVEASAKKLSEEILDATHDALVFLR